jgi:hypothetical protein
LGFLGDALAGKMLAQLPFMQLHKSVLVDIWEKDLALPVASGGLDIHATANQVEWLPAWTAVIWQSLLELTLPVHPKAGVCVHGMHMLVGLDEGGPVAPTSLWCTGLHVHVFR